MENDKSLSFTCRHANQAEIEGCLTCIECGLVMSENVYEQSFESSTNNTLYKNTPNLELLREIYHKNFISRELLDLCTTYINKWRLENIPYSKYHVSYAIYYCSGIINFPISLSEISKLFQLSPKKICSLEKYIPSQKLVSSQSFVAKYCAMLKIPFTQEKELIDLCSIIDRNFSVQPSVSSAALISLLKNDCEHALISAVSMVTIPTIRKWKKKFDKFLQERGRLPHPAV